MVTTTAARRRATKVPTLVELTGPRCSGRIEAEGFVRRAFALAYGADVTHFLPSLMTLHSDQRQLLAVLGLRAADHERLFLEQYLDLPVEQQLGAAAGGAVARASLVEVGNFAVGAAGGGRWLITALTAYLYSAGRDWAVFTCGPELKNAFHRMGIALVDLGPADPARLEAGEWARWGSYYRQRPRVMAARVAQSHAVLAGLFGTECALNALWRHALNAGRLAG